MLNREEYVEQAYFFRTICERLPKNMPLQEIFAGAKEELLATAKLPMAVDFMLNELLHSGAFAPAMKRLPHYFSPYQVYLVHEAEEESGRFDMRIAFEILRQEAEYQSESPTPQGLFMYQFESLCRNRLKYDPGLKAISDDPMYDENWREWILNVRRQVGIVDFADLLYVRSAYFVEKSRRSGRDESIPDRPILFGEKEGKIAFANRQKDPLYLFSALQRHLSYPKVPRPKAVDDTPELIPQILVRLQHLETRIQLIDQEMKEGIDITSFYANQNRQGLPPE